VVTVSAIAVLLLAVVGGMAWQSSSHAKLERLLGEAQLALSSGENREALARADRVLAADPDFPGARLARARALFWMLGREHEAIVEGEALIAADPDDWVGHGILVAAANGSFYSKPLEPHVEAVERLAPETAEAYTLRAIISDSSLEALELLDQALQIDPGYAPALLARAVRHLGRMNPLAALEDADRLLAARPRSPAGRWLRTKCFLALYDMEAARKEIDEAIRLAPDAEYYAQRSDLRQDLEEMERAWDDIEMAVELEPENREWHLKRAWIALNAGKLDDALEAVRKRQRRTTKLVERKVGRIIPSVFHRNGEPIKSFRGSWNKARKEAGLEGQLVHDLRRTAVRNLERAGVPRSVAMKLTGHKTESVYRRYAIVSEADLSEGLKKLSSLLKTNLSESRKVIYIASSSA